LRPVATLPHASPSAEGLESRLEFETLISDTSAALFASAPEQLDHAVEHALERVRGFFQADRCALLHVSEDQQVVRLRLAAYAEGVAPVAADVNLAEVFPWSRQKLLVERVAVRISRPADLPSEAAVEREIWARFPIQSALSLPIESAGIVRHLIVLNTVQRERHWPDAFVTRLRVLGELLVGALERRDLFGRLRRSEARMDSGAELAGLGFYEVDLAEGVMYADDRLRDLCGVPQDRTAGLQTLEFWLEHLHPDDRQRMLDLRQKMHEGTLARLSVEYRYLHPTRGEQWIHHLAGATTRDAGGRAVRTYGVLRDITLRKRADDELRDLSRRLIRAHEEERALLARELHDDLTQRLAVLAIDVGRAEVAAPGGAQGRTMKAVREGLAIISEDIHSLAYQLHPSVLEELGLTEALRTECDRIRRRGDLELEAELDEPSAPVGKDAALCLFRIAQEALNNVIRHSGARAASLTLRQMDDGLLLAVRDGGSGFDPEKPGTGRRLGLASMRERVRLVNGTLDIESTPGRGTAITAWIPREGSSP
jgi:PAS domain S-box-containing protein